MSDKTKIEWADATLNYANGCSVVSPGCTNCYAMRLAGTRMKHHPSRAGLTIDTKAGPVWNGDVRLSETALLQPLRWKRPRRIFWNAHGDLFHEKVTDAQIDRLFAVCALTPQHTHMILTKRSARMRAYFSASNLGLRRDAAVWNLNHSGANPGRGCTPFAIGTAVSLPNVWLGVSVEDQARADERIPDLLATPAAVRFLSCEPLLGPVDLKDDSWSVAWMREVGFPGIDWVIAGGESGPGARPMHPDWARGLRDQCAAAGVPFHFKQWGEFAPQLNRITGDVQEPCVVESRGDPGVAWPDCTTGDGRSDAKGGLGSNLERVGKKRAGRLLDGVTHDGLPEPVA